MDVIYIYFFKDAGAWGCDKFSQVIHEVVKVRQPACTLHCRGLMAHTRPLRRCASYNNACRMLLLEVSARHWSLHGWSLHGFIVSDVTREVKDTVRLWWNCYSDGAENQWVLRYQMTLLGAARLATAAPQGGRAWTLPPWGTPPHCIYILPLPSHVPQSRHPSLCQFMISLEASPAPTLPWAVTSPTTNSFPPRRCCNTRLRQHLRPETRDPRPPH